MKAERMVNATARGRSRGSSLIPHPSSLALCIALGCAVPGAWCQELTDPTRPPAGFAAGEPDAPSEGAALVLQSVVISPAGKSAIINGETVKLGQKYRDAVLVSVTESEVVLKSDGTTQVLKMYPGVDKRAPAAAKTAPRQRGKGQTAAPAAAAAPR